MSWFVAAARAVKGVAPKAIQALRKTSAGSKIIGKLSATSSGKIVARSAGSTGGKALAAAKSALGAGGSASVGKVGARMTSGIAKMPKPMRWAADLTGAKTLAGGMARFGTKTTALGKVKTAAMLGGGGLMLKSTYGWFAPGGDEPVTTPGDIETTQLSGAFNPDADEGGAGTLPNPVTGKGYGEYLKNPVVLGALAAVGIGVGAYALKKTIAKKVIGTVVGKIRGKKKTTAKGKKTSRAKSNKKYTFAALAKQWKKLSKAGKAKYEGQFSAFIKVKREAGITAKKTTTKRKKTTSKKASGTMKKQQNRMRTAAKKWKSYKGNMSYQSFMSKELKK